MAVDDAVLATLREKIEAEFSVVNIRRRELRDMQAACLEIEKLPRDEIVPEVPEVPATFDTSDPPVELTPTVPVVPEHTIQIFDIIPKDKSTGKDVSNTRRQAIYDKLLADETKLGL